MMASNELLLVLMSVFAVLLLALAAVSFYGWRKIQTLQMQLQSMHTQQQQVTDTAVTVGRKLLLLQKDLQNVAQRMHSNDHFNSEYKAYNQAATLLAQGAKLDDVIEQCHLSRGEAELLASMHRAAQGERPS